jgi:hypothetical protein
VAQKTCRRNSPIQKPSVAIFAATPGSAAVCTLGPRWCRHFQAVPACHGPRSLAAVYGIDKISGRLLTALAIVATPLPQVPATTHSSRLAGVGYGLTSIPPLATKFPATLLHTHASACQSPMRPQPARSVAGLTLRYGSEFKFLSLLLHRHGHGIDHAFMS